MKNIFTPLLLIIAATLLIQSCSNKASKDNQSVQNNEPVKEAEMVDYFADNGLGNSVVTKAESGEHYKGVTYVAYQGTLEDAYVAAYNHRTQKWDGPYKAGVSILGKTPGKRDGHGKPTLIVDDEGFIHVAFGGHGGLKSHGENTLGNPHSGKQIHVVSKEPMDISSWEELDNISPFGTYSQFLKMDNGDIYLFYRHGGHQSNWTYQKSTDHGRTFSPEVSILKTKKRGTPDVADAWYADFRYGEGNDIIATFNYHKCKTGNLKHDGERHNAYYMVLNTDNSGWRNVKGEKLTLPITKEHADSLALIEDTGDLWTHIGTVILDDKGNPIVTSFISEHMGLKNGGPRHLKAYHWKGNEWIAGSDSILPIITNDAKSDIQFTSPNEINLILAYNDDSNNGEVAWWNSTDDGKNFTKGDVWFKSKNKRFALSPWIRNAHPDARILAAGISGNGEHVQMFLLGDNGPIKRLKTEADIIE